MERQEPSVDSAATFELMLEGARCSMRVGGPWLMPLLHCTEVVQVERCGERALSPGAIAVVRRPNRAPIIQIVESTRPLRLASFGGPLLATGTVLGRVLSTPFGPSWWGLRQNGRWLHLAHLWYRWAKDGAFTRALAAALSFASAVPPGLLIRRVRLGRLSARLLSPEDVRAVVAFVGDHTELRLEFIERQLARRWQRFGAAAGVEDGGGRLVGFAFLDQYTEEGVAVGGHWIRNLVVAPRARRLGVGAALVSLLLDAARRRGLREVRADIRTDNVASRALFARAGFSPASSELEVLLNRAVGAPDGRYVVVSRTP